MRELYGDWRDVLKSFRIALDPRKITLAVGGILLSTIFVLIALTVIFAFAVKDKGVYNSIVNEGGVGLVHELIVAGKQHLDGAPVLLFLVLFVVFVAEWFVWAYFGGAIARIAAIEVARDERIELNESMKFAGQKFRSFFWSPVAIVLAILFFGLCNAGAGLLGRIPWGVGQLIVSVPLILALFSGFLMTLLLVGLVFGLPLMIPTIAVEGTDSFDAISRSMSYLYARPWRYLWCKIVGLAYGVPCLLFVGIFTCLFWNLGVESGALGMGKSSFTGMAALVYDAKMPVTVLGKIGATIFTSWYYLVWLALFGYIVSYILTLDTITYLVLRKAEDGTEMTEVYEEEEENSWKPPKDESEDENKPEETESSSDSEEKKDDEEKSE